MPTIDDFAPHAPFALDELVTAVNTILRDRPSLQIQARTVRFYISNGLLPPPSGGPKYARYGVEHLRRIVAIRQWLDQGLSLEQAAERIKKGEHGGDTETHRKQSLQMPDRPPVYSAPAPASSERTVKRIYLTEHCVLELVAGTDEGRELERAARSLDRLIKGKTTSS